ncbi:hypothetical protein GO986_12935 [Deinococcus sp. HMF7620]|uniref:Uncharacterized protein n=1 Tax=Deinococcus arboris TaxID=2682977 RepID=A0A7C9HSL7_9DEIO|nr:hypothetical protein [Deinococcus arboris]
MTPLFGFRLRPLPELLERWTAGGADPLPYLRGWYWLTDGWYWLRTPAGDVPTNHPEFDYALGQPPGPEPHLDYLVARFWLDLEGLLPRVLEPLPAELAAALASGAWDAWHAPVSAWWHALPDDDEQASWELWSAATSWANVRALDMGYLAAPPLLRFWRVGENVNVAWDTREQRVQGHLCWTETWGQQAMSVAAFAAEVEDFRGRLDTAMTARVQAVAALGQLDAAALTSLAQQRQLTLFPESGLQDPTDWGAVLSAIRRLEEGSGTPLLAL